MLMSDMITAGSSHPQCMEIPVPVPAPYHVELVSALIIHPHHNNRSPRLASLALTFLRDLLAILGPLNASLREAFCFSPTSSFRSMRGSRHVRYTAGVLSGLDSDDRAESINGKIANRDRLRTRARDFWHVVGWAFNCSVNFPQRWMYWKVWLEYMLDVLDADWSERDRLNGLSEEEVDMRQDSLLVMYLSEVRGQSTAVRRVVKSLFADGSVESTRDFPEVFSKESNSTLKSFTRTKHRRESGYHDYISKEIEDETERLVPIDLVSDITDDLGGPESIALRQRVLALLLRIGYHLPDIFVGHTAIFELVYECMKPLSMAAFSLFVAPSTSTRLGKELSVSLSQTILYRFLSTVVERTVDELSQDVLEKCFLPFAANTSSVSDNAKVSILIESLLRLFIKDCPCKVTARFRATAEQGILEREKKIRRDRKRKTDATEGEEQDEIWLTTSANRIRNIITWLDQAHIDLDTTIRLLE